MIDLRLPQTKDPYYCVMGNTPTDMIFVCVWVGDKYPESYVNRLYHDVNKHTDNEFKFYCLTDNKLSNDNIIPIPVFNNRQGWWQKTSLFAKDLFPHGAIVVYMDLDVVITNKIDWLWGVYSDKSLCMIKNFGPNRGHSNHNSSVMTWMSGNPKLHCIDENMSDEVIKKLPSDRDWETELYNKWV